MKWSGFGEGTAKNGTVSYNGQTYTIDSFDSIRSLYSAMSGIGVNVFSQIDNSNSTEQMRDVLRIEAADGNGVKSSRWNSGYIYNKDSIMFTKQS